MDVKNEGSWCSIVGSGRAFNIMGFMEEYHHQDGPDQGAVFVPQEPGDGGKESSRVLYSTVSVFGELKGKIRAGCFAEVAFVANRCGHKRQ